MTITVYCGVGTFLIFEHVTNIVRVRKDYISIKRDDGSISGYYLEDDGGIVSIVFEEENNHGQ